MRLSVCNQLESRDGTLSKDAKLKNLLIEQIDGKSTAIKRPGVENGFAGITAGVGQGIVSLDGSLYVITDDTLYIGGGGYGSGGGVQTIEPWRPEEEYEVDDEVSYDGSRWTSITSTRGVPPPSGWNEVSSGENWQQVSGAILPTSVTGGSFDYPAVEFGGKMWIIDAPQSTSYPFWNSTDLVSWTAVGSYPPTVSVSGLTVFSGKIWIWDSVNYAYSTNGVSWTEGSATGSGAGSAVMKDFDGVLCGLKYFNAGFTHYWIQSNDGIAFTETLTNLPTAGSVRRLVKLGGVFYAIPNGYNQTAAQNASTVIYSSTDGVTWTSLGSAWGISRRYYEVAVFSGKCYVIGGQDASGTLTNSVYSSSDMSTWNLESYTSSFTARNQPTALSYEGKFTILGGGGFTDAWQLTSSGISPPTSIPL